MFATKTNADYAIIVGEDEIKNNYYSVKNLKEFSQQQLSLENIITLLKERGLESKQSFTYLPDAYTELVLHPAK